MYVNVDFVIRCLYSAVSTALVREQRFIRIIIIVVMRKCTNHAYNAQMHEPCWQCAIAGSVLVMRNRWKRARRLAMLLLLGKRILSRAQTKTGTQYAAAESKLDLNRFIDFCS